MNKLNLKTVTIKYFASLQEQSKINQENIETELMTYRELYNFLADKYQFTLSDRDIKIAVNDEFSHLDETIADQVNIVFIPPVAGG
jgi:molybdopterin synthase sulfur carrier subunit